MLPLRGEEGLLGSAWWKEERLRESILMGWVSKTCLVITLSCMAYATLLLQVKAIPRPAKTNTGSFDFLLVTRSSGNPTLPPDLADFIM
jgi:hypothetical protein